MKVVHVVRQFAPSVGGLEDFVLNLALHQVESGVDVSVYTLNTNNQTGELLEGEEDISGILVRRYRWWGSYRYPICCIPPSDLSGFDVVHVHGVDFFADYISLLKRAGKISKKLVLTTHGGFFHTNKNAWLKKVFFNTVTPLSISKFDKVVCCSVNDFSIFSKFNNSKIIENGVVQKKFGEGDTRSSASDLLYLGRFSENKRVQDLVEEFLRCSAVPGKLKIVGRSNSGDLECLRRIVDGASNVDLLLDLDDEEILSHIATSRFVVSASEYEGFGLSVIELMSYGLIPVLSSNPESFRKFVAESGVGSVFNLGDDSFKSVMSELIDSDFTEEKNKAIGYAAKFSWPSVSEKYLNVYR